MRRFKDFNIKSDNKHFQGEKVKMNKILNTEIFVYAFKIEKSKFEKGNNECLHMQISIGSEKRVLFTGSGHLIELIKKVPENEFPFATTIIKENERYEFT